MKFLHCADLHLDSKLESNLGKEKARERKNEILMTFLKMVDYAKRRSVDAILISGDLFDTKTISAKAKNLVWDAVCQNPTIDFIYLKGNHDFHTTFLDNRVIPANFKTFGLNWTEIRYDYISVFGRNNEEAQTDYASLVTDASRVNIVMMHGQENAAGHGDNAQIISLKALKNRNIDYLALGHVHLYKKERLDTRGIYCYPGCLEGRGFDECGVKGAVLLNVSRTEITTEFVPFSQRCLHTVEVDITGQITSMEIMQKIKKETADILSKDMVKVVLTGNCELETQKDLSFYSKALEELFYFVKIVDQSRLSIHYEDYEKMISLKGEFVRTVLNAKLGEEEKEKIILLGIRALSGEDLEL